MQTASYAAERQSKMYVLYVLWPLVVSDLFYITYMYSCFGSATETLAFVFILLVPSQTSVYSLQVPRAP